MMGVSIFPSFSTVKRPRGEERDPLSCGLVGTEGGLVSVASRSLGVLGLLCDQRNTSLVALSWDNSNSLYIQTISKSFRSDPSSFQLLTSRIPSH